MKVLCKAVLIIFILFLATPTIVSAINKDIDTSYFFNMSEEENDAAFNEIKSIPTIYSIPLVIDYEGLPKTKFSIFTDRRTNANNPTIFLQPPELV